MLKAPIRILIVAVLCALGLIGLVVRETMARSQGTEVLLAMEAVDPRSLLSGHYVIVSLHETLPTGENCPPGLWASQLQDQFLAQESPSAESWVAIVSAGDHHRVVASVDSRAEALRMGQTSARGRAYCEPRLRPTPTSPSPPAFIRSDLSIDRFHATQSEAERIERVLRSIPGQPSGGDVERLERQVVVAPARIFAIISIGKDGRARLKGLQVDGERLELDWL